MSDILMMEPVFKETIWGGNRLRTDFHYNIDGETIGECWGISAHSSGDCVVAQGQFKGMQLSELWDKHRDLFGNIEGDVFPLLVKIIDAKDDLSIQVHPDNQYAAIHENGSLGKTECWYILDCDEGADIVIGHNAKSTQELKDMTEQERWDELIKAKPIQKGDFFQIEPGTVHAIRKGTLLLETQQSSDITYRLYDYGRIRNGKPRQLHLKQSIDVIKCPHVDVKIDNKIEKLEDMEKEQLIHCNFYTVEKLKIFGNVHMEQNHPFVVMSVIDGNGYVDDIEICKGSHFILPAGYGTYYLKGNMEIISSYI